MRSLRWHAALAIALALGACGARTGLDVPEPDAARADGGADGGLDVGPTCGPAITLLPAHADVVLVLDRSGSMTRMLATSSATRWDALHAALASALPTFDANVAFGASIFPIPDATIDAGTVCTVGATLDVPVMLDAAPAILRALEAHVPSGGTPTTSAITAAANALTLRRRTGVPQSIVLATDGGPNCDPADRAEPWFGQAPETCAESGVDPQLCLDTTRTVASITSAASAGVPTYVIAMDVSESYLVDALRAMALAGARPRTGGGEPYYDVRNPDDLTAAFGDIATRVSSCSFIPETPPTREVIVVEVDGEAFTRDDSGASGWTLGASGTFDLHGSACERAMRPDARVRIVDPCH